MRHCQDWPYCATSPCPICGTGDEIETCPVCGATSPCYLDDQGRALVHSDAFPTAATGLESDAQPH